MPSSPTTSIANPPGDVEHGSFVPTKPGDTEDGLAPDIKQFVPLKDYLTNIADLFDPATFFSAVELSAKAQVFELREQLGVLEMREIEWDVKGYGGRVMLRAVVRR